MSESYRVVAGRIRRELSDLERVVIRAERALTVTRQDPEHQDLYLDSAALNLHDFYAGLERLFALIASSIEGSVPTGHEWHRELLRQMASPVPQIRPAVLSPEVTKELEEYLGFRHVVRNIYAFAFDLERIARLVQRLRSTFAQAQTDLLVFADLLEQIAQD